MLHIFRPRRRVGEQELEALPQRVGRHPGDAGHGLQEAAPGGLGQRHAARRRQLRELPGLQSHNPTLDLIYRYEIYIQKTYTDIIHDIHIEYIQHILYTMSLYTSHLHLSLFRAFSLRRTKRLTGFSKGPVKSLGFSRSSSRFVQLGGRRKRAA